MRRPATCRVAWPALGLLTLVAAPVWAQQAAPAMSATPAQSAQPASQDAGGSSRNPGPTAPPLELRLSVTQTFTDNVSLSTDGKGDAITRVSPGLRLISRTGRFQGFVDYTLNSQTYARSGNGTDLRNALAANGTAEVLERHAYVDAQAAITQQSVNPLDVQSTDSQLGRANRTEVRSLGLTPRVRGRLGDVAQWDASVAYATSRATSSVVSSSTITTSQVRLSNAEARTLLGWQLQASHVTRDFTNGRSTMDDTLRGVLDYRPSPELNIGVIGGYESTDIVSPTKEGRATHGLRLNWVPSNRTQLHAEVERRFFGNAYNVSFVHRLPRSVLSFTDVRSLSNGVGQPITVSLGSWHDLLDKQFSSAVADAAEREALVQAYINQYNLNPNAEVLQSFLTSSVTLQRQQQLSYAWLLQRDVLTLSLQQSNAQRASTAAINGDVLSTNSELRQRGYSLTLAHRLTPLSTVTLGYTQRQSSGDLVSTSLRSATAQWSTRLNRRASFSLLGRHARFSSTLVPYRETALVGTFGMTF